jgi:hypothetical protein
LYSLPMSKLIKLAIVVAIVVFIWKKGMPWWEAQHSGSASSASAGDSCTPYADSAANSWSSGIRKFVSPPYDMAAWDSFRGDVQTRISEAESHCSCNAESCAKAKEAMSGLRGMVSDVDGMIRNNTAPPSNIVARQEDVDNLVDQAKELARQGK